MNVFFFLTLHPDEHFDTNCDDVSDTVSSRHQITIVEAAGTRRPLEIITSSSHKAILSTSVVYEWRGMWKKYLKVSCMKR
jgi:hypothetical protein